MPVRLVVEGGPYAGVLRGELVRRARAMLGALDRSSAELSLLLTDDDRIRELNGIYRKKNKPTDVLAFSQLEGEGNTSSRKLLGDVVLSVPTARRQADDRGCELMTELTMLLAHGLLHLLGWDHDTPRKDDRMRRETQRLCRVAYPAGAALGASRRRSRPVKGRTEAKAFGHSLVGRAARTAR
ncbi:MAG TPA: rRNA maturation RNase YbeY [Polyangiaceae bacterium]|nr:rRNA maturation RNase YbeY [Polyangiaceae bacterium]